MKKIAIYLPLVLLFLTPTEAFAAGAGSCDNPTGRPQKLFSNIGDNTLKSFAGRNFFLHLAAVGSTYAIVHTGTDFEVHDYFRRNTGLGAVFAPVVATGSLGPVLAGTALYFRGRSGMDSRTQDAGSAVLQANLITVVYVSLLKAVTGRPNPDEEKYGDIKELSREFDFGFLNNGIFWGWPSGHAAATATTLSALSAFYPEKRWLRYGGYAFIGYTVIGVSAVGGGEMHWFSDGVAGALMGYAVGDTVGKTYGKAHAGRNAPVRGNRILLLPFYYGGAPGVKAVVEF